MKKILVSLIMLCTAVSAWSQTTYTTKEVILLFSDHDTSWKTTDIETNISVQATPFTTNKEAGNNWWKVGGNFSLGLFSPEGYVITGVKFTFISSDLASNSESIENCDCLVFDTTNETWKQNDGGLDYYSTIRFTSSSLAYVRSVKITYHKHEFAHNEGVTATCVATGKTESWTCSDCGRTYSDAKGASEVAKAEDLVLPIDPTNHPEALEEHARVEATCIKDGNVQYWHCDHCDKNFGDAEGKGDEIVNVVIPKEQGSHNHLTSVAQKDATCTESGYTKNHWHCSDCGKNFEEEACTTQITDEVVIPAINHKNKTFTDYVAPTTEAEGNVAYWHCPDCDKHFEDASCTKELTEWVLAKLVNMMHLCFDGTSVPVETEHYMNTAKFNFTDDGDVILTVNGESVTYDKEMIDKVKFSNGTPTVTISANEDPGKGIYYSTFYSSLESYAVPEGFTAYRGEISTDGKVLNLTSVKDDVMARGEGYILRGTTSSGSMNVTENADGGSTGNVLLGFDKATALPDNSYALSLGQNGVGFYKFGGDTLPANKAYLTLASGSAISLRFSFGDATDIDIIETEAPAKAYNLQGQQVDENYKGIVIVNGKKYVAK